MQFMKRLAILVGVCVIAAPALADWDTTDPHKMHAPQLPDAFGYDIDMTRFVLADDWQCSKTGDVTDIHFWYSVQGDRGQIPPPHIASIKASIHLDIPTGPGGFSIPGELKWSGEFTNFRIAGPFTGVQGWDSPEANSLCEADDHTVFWQVNITDIADPFTQELGEIYWLDLQIVPPSGTNLQVGWKTSLDHFRDWAVYMTAAGGWEQIAVCTSNSLTDLAFVITPEPGTLVLLGLGGLAMLRRRRR